MTKWDIFMLSMQVVTIATTAVNFWCFYKVPILKRSIKLLTEANDNLRGAHDGLIEQHRLVIDEAVRLSHLLNGRR